MASSVPIHGLARLRDYGAKKQNATWSGSMFANMFAKQPNSKPSGLSETMLSEMFLYRLVDEVLMLAAQVETGVFKPVFGRDGDPRRKGNTLFDL